MRPPAPRALVVLSLLTLAGLAASLPVPDAPLPPWLAEGNGPFSHVVCPFLGAPDPARPLEVCNVRATAATGPASEISLALDPADPAHMVVAAKGFNYTRLLGSSFQGGVITPYATSFDGGVHWTEGYLQPLDQVYATLPNGLQVGETTKHESDPVVGWGQDGQPLIQTLRVNQGGGLPMYRSDDAGATFHPIGSAFNGGTDKNWFVRDPLTGNLYTGTLFSGGIGFTKSTDGGRTWSAAKKVLTGAYVTIDVGPGGVIYMASNGGGKVHFTRSLDQGATWSAQRDIAPEAGAGTYADGRLFRTPDFAQLAASRTTDDVYVAVTLPGGTLPFNAGPSEDWGVFVAHSADAGLTWSAPVRVDQGLPAFRFMPEIAVSPQGDVHVAWLDQRLDPGGQTVTAFYAHSGDRGATWGPNVLVSDAPFLADLGHHQSITNGVFIGDYMGLSASDDRAVLAFPDTRYGRADIFVATIV